MNINNNLSVPQEPSLSTTQAVPSTMSMSSTDQKIRNTHKRNRDNEAQNQSKKQKVGQYIYSMTSADGRKIEFQSASGGYYEATETRPDGSHVKFTMKNKIREGVAKLWDPKVGMTTFTYKQGIKQGPAKTELLNGISLFYSFTDNQPFGQGTATYQNRSITCPIADGKIHCSEATLAELFQKNIPISDETNKNNSSITDFSSQDIDLLELSETEFLANFSDYISNIKTHEKKSD